MSISRGMLALVLAGGLLVAATDLPATGPAADTTFTQISADGDNSVKTTLASCPQLCEGNAQGERDAVLQFSVAGLPGGARVTKATLELYSWNPYAARVSAYAATGSASSPGTWSARPALTGVLQTNPSVTAGYNAFDVTSAVTGNGSRTFAVLQETYNNRVYWASKENANTAIRPKLTVTYDVPAGWNLVWQDNFDGTSLDTAKWNALTNTSVDYDKACITNRPNNVFVSGGNLTIRAQSESFGARALSHFSVFIPTLAGSSMLAGLYQTPAIYVSVKGVMTNTVPTDAYRGAGRPEAAYLLERFVDHIAREVGLSPDELRARNFIKPAQIPFKTALGDSYDSGDFETVMRKGMAKADWTGFAARKAQSAKAGKWRGIGMATYVEKCSGGGPETIKAKFNDDATLTIFTGNQTNGQGHETALKQIASAKFGIDVERINLVQGDSDVVPEGFTGGSRTIAINGNATIAVADKIIAKGKPLAANLLEAAAADIDYADGAFKIVGTDRSVSLFDVAKANKGALDDEHTRTPEADTFPNGCHICELEVDPDTATVEIKNYTVVDDFGMALNPLLLQGQIHGGIGQGVGQALTEHTVYDLDSGQLLSGSFMDYAFPRADIVPHVAFDMHNSPCTTNPLGVKGAGEAGAIGAPPAVINAIVSAIEGHTGTRHIDMPVTPASLWAAIASAKQKKAA